ncbi:MAG: aminotransferase class I/II-fold pyridoxal phosphate-dependent enzyme [Candidatus Hydrogenedentes bacterium]|nr:aminotransferase class I/II-fold pyridoxal phosphate-dependent enzyme [Candidatus Hydrogenedentota bacterium]
MKKNKKTKADIRNTPGKGISTFSVHAGEERFRYADSITTPIVQTSTYAFKNTDHIEAYTRHGHAHFEYGRYGNPTEKVAQDRMAIMCGAEDCVLFASGMSAITTTILALVRSQDHIIITDDAYKKTLEFCSSYLQRFGIDCTIVPFGDYDGIEKAIRPNTRFIFSESPTNPYLNIFDLEWLRDIAKRYNLMTLIDATFSTPYNQCPFDYGVDIVLHSATKYLAGHNDILAGVVLGREELVEKIRALHKAMGGVIDPHCSYLLLRGMKTFALRMERQNNTALQVAQLLEDHTRIKQVYYPGLESHPHHDIARAQMSGYGGVVSFDIKGTLKNAKYFLDALKLCYIAPSLGGVETLITHPALVSYYNLTRKERYGLGITDTLVRLAVGIEEPEDIIADIDQALKKSRG